MTVFKAFLHVLNKCKGMVILYTALLLLFGGINSKSGDTASQFTADKPEIVIVNQDENVGITKNFTDYIAAHSELKELKSEEDIDDAIFYRQVAFVIYIPQGYRQAVLNGETPELRYKSCQSADASFAQMMVESYLAIQQNYVDAALQANPDEMNISLNEAEVCEDITQTLEQTSTVHVTTTLDTNSMSKAAGYYNFASYSLLAGAIFVICLVLTSFQGLPIRKRITISSMNYKKHNAILLASNLLFAMALWLFYGLISFVIVGKAMFSAQRAMYLVNSFVFTLCALTMAFLISSIFNNKEAVNGIVNVVALGSAFLCGAFIPVEWLPDGVLAVGRIFPAYWYIQTNEYLKTLETVSVSGLKPVFINMLVMALYGVFYIIVANIVSAKKRVVA